MWGLYNEININKVQNLKKWLKNQIVYKTRETHDHPISTLALKLDKKQLLPKVTFGKYHDL